MTTLTAPALEAPSGKPAAAPAASSSREQGQEEDAGSTQRIAKFIDELSSKLTSAVDEINEINANTKLLALNARIEAARAGEAGAAFSVVAGEVQSLSGKTSDVARDLATKTRDSIDDLMHIIDNRVRGTRLSDIALTNIDLIDRNLYERTCDVRWWATDSSVIDALTESTDEYRRFACYRLGVILNSYTVYYDLVLADTEGNIVANGRPELYASIGKNVSSKPWFQQAMKSASGDEYGFETAHRCALVDDQPVLIYSCAVREKGEANGRVLGVLGIIFNWEGLAQTIMKSAPFSPSEAQVTRCCIVDDDGLIIADSQDQHLQDHFRMELVDQIRREKKSFVVCEYHGVETCIAYAQAPGFETYSTGWNSLIVQPMNT